MVFDTVKNTVILMGGDNYSKRTFQDIWSFNGKNWNEIGIFNKPSSYDFIGSEPFIFDIHRKKYIYVNSGVIRLGTKKVTWEMDGIVEESNQFLQLEVTGPLGRFDYALCYDIERKKVVLYGGVLNSYPETIYTNDTWKYDGNIWKKISTEGPSTRRGAKMVYHAELKAIFLFGGYDLELGGYDLEKGYLNDLWKWDGKKWEMIISKGEMPSPRASYALAYDSNKNKILLFGGYKGKERFCDTWEW